MYGARTVLLILLLLAGSLSPPGARAQESRARAATSSGQGFSLEQNYPTTVNPETWIPFHLEESLFESSDSVVVSLRILNILRQVVAIAEVETGSGRERQRDRLFNRSFREPGRWVAYWNGENPAGQRVPTGVYYAELTVDGRTRTRKLVVENPTRRRSILPRL